MVPLILCKAFLCVACIYIYIISMAKLGVINTVKKWEPYLITVAYSRIQDQIILKRNGAYTFETIVTYLRFVAQSHNFTWCETQQVFAKIPNFGSMVGQLTVQTTSIKPTKANIGHLLESETTQSLWCIESLCYHGIISWWQSMPIHTKSSFSTRSVSHV